MSVFMLMVPFSLVISREARTGAAGSCYRPVAEL
jgi:hypothetical protein